MSFIEYIFAQFNADSYQISFNFLVSKCLARQTCITLKFDEIIVQILSAKMKS